jgi:hypothetical protein
MYRPLIITGTSLKSKRVVSVNSNATAIHVQTAAIPHTTVARFEIICGSFLFKDQIMQTKIKINNRDKLKNKCWVISICTPHSYYLLNKILHLVPKDDNQIIHL